MNKKTTYHDINAFNAFSNLLDLQAFVGADSVRELLTLSKEIDNEDEDSTELAEAA